ncbi:MAG: phosphatidylglycerophosphatase A [Myxococcota bacterium]
MAGGFGAVPLAPGTAGSFAGVLVFGIVGSVAASAEISQANFPVFYALVVGLLLLLGIQVAGRAEIDFGRCDDPRIVIDEVVGQLIALTPLVPLLWVFTTTDADFSWGLPSINPFGAFIFEVVTGFVLFRLFDVWKPGVIRWTEQRFGGGWGVMADDVVAGIYAALCLLVLHGLVFEGLYLNHPAWALVSRSGLLGWSGVAL